MRPSKRQPGDLRPVSFQRAFSLHAEGSCLIKFGNTHVLCTASLEERVPPWLKGQGRGWITAEYGMLPRATSDRTRREALNRASIGAQPGNPAPDRPRACAPSSTCTRLASGRSWWTAMSCRPTAARAPRPLPASWIALHDCFQWMRARDMIKDGVLKDHVAAVSCGIYKGESVLDLDYPEDSEAEADANFVFTGQGPDRRGAGHRGKGCIFRGAHG